MAVQTTLETHVARTSAAGGFLPIAARILMGLIFLVMGLNGFLHFLPAPKTPMPPGALAYLGALAKTGYMVPLIFGTQTIVGILLLVNRFVPLALALTAPVIVNIIGFHIFLSPATAAPGVVVTILEMYLVWLNWPVYKTMLAAHTTTSVE